MIESIIEFWFGPLAGPEDFTRDRYEIWFRNGRTYDALIRERFGAVYEQACRGELDAWTATPRGRLALILLLDQFSRHIHRDTPLAFAQDRKAQALTRTGVALGHDQRLFPIQRTFFYLPLEHAEDLALQEESVALFSQLVAEVAPALKPDFEGFLEYARHHRDVIAQFGRFPDLNPLLGRDSTAEESAFLRQPGSSLL